MIKNSLHIESMTSFLVQFPTLTINDEAKYYTRNKYHSQECCVLQLRNAK